METRAVYVDWAVALKAPERLLDDLARWTDINTVILGTPFYRFDAKLLKGAWSAPWILPSAQAFGDLPVPVVSGAEFDSLLGFVDAVKAKGFKVSCNVMPIHLVSPELDSLSCVDVTGQPLVDRTSLVVGCPNNPEVVEYGRALVSGTVSSWRGLDMLDFNHLEYCIWPRTGLREMFACFCRWCQQKAEAQGIDFDEMKGEVRRLYDALVSPHAPGEGPVPILSANELLNVLVERPHLATWLNFRMSSMSEFITSMVEAARESAREHNPGLQIGLGFFLPSVSNLVGTDFARLYSLFDWVAPKFPEYVTGSVVPLIADEVAAKTGRWSASELRPVVRELYGLGPGPKEYQEIPKPTEALLYSNTFDVSVIEGQMKYLRPLVGKVPMYPWIWLNNRDLEGVREKVKALREHGFDGYFLWVWEPDLSPESLKASKGVF